MKHSVCRAISTLALLSAMGHAAPLRIERVSDLNFGSAAPGEAQKQIPKVNHETASNASFSVNGDAHASFQVILPNEITMQTTSAHLGKKHIRVFHFQVSPDPLVLNAQGNQRFYVSATREALSTNQAAGTYSGAFVVEVVYE